MTPLSYELETIFSPPLPPPVKYCISSFYYVYLPGWSYFSLFIRELDVSFFLIELGLSHLFMFQLAQQQQQQQQQKQNNNI